MAIVVNIVAMPTQKPRITIRFENDEYKLLQKWAESEIRSVPQLIYAVVIKALKEKYPDENKSLSRKDEEET